MAIKLIHVKSGRNDNRVALWEKHPDHPEGEAWVAGEGVVQVAKTSKVLSGLKEGDLVEADAPAEKKAVGNGAAVKKEVTPAK